MNPQLTSKLNERQRGRAALFLLVLLVFVLWRAMSAGEAGAHIAAEPAADLKLASTAPGGASYEHSDPRRTPVPDSLYPFPEQRVGIASFHSESLDLARINTRFYKLEDRNPYPWEAAVATDFITVLRVGPEYYLHAPRDFDGTYWDWVRSLIVANPGHTWLIGNEPENPCRGNRSSFEYAEIYHELFTFIKSVDSTATVGIGGVVLPSEMRRRWLDRVLTNYQNHYGLPMPIEVWTVHDLLLSESAGPCVDTGPNPCYPKKAQSGGYVPREFWCEDGNLYDEREQVDFAEFQRLLIEFRQWMKARGFRETPLYVTEMGVLAPIVEKPEGPFPEEWIFQFMHDIFEWLRTATDPEIGYPADGDRLVQRWVWFSLERSEFNGALFDEWTYQITDLGVNFGNYLARFLPNPQNHIFFSKGWSGYAQDTDVWISPREARPHAYTAEMMGDGSGRVLLNFDLSMLPRNVEVISATLTMFTAGGQATAETAVHAYEVNRPWDLALATWTQASDGVPWEAPGCDGVNDRDAVPLDSVTIGGAQAAHSWNITSAARRWVGDPATNHGLLLVAESDSATNWWFYLADQPEQPPYDMFRYRPRLDLNVQLALLPTPTPGPSATPTATRTRTPTLTARYSATPTATATPVPWVVCLQQNSSPEASYGGVADTFLDGQGDMNANYGQSPELRIYYESRKRVLLRFELQEYIPANAVVTGAHLDLYTTGNWYAERTTRIGAYELLRPWDENSATWYAPSTGELWQVPGAGEGDRSLNPVASTILENRLAWHRLDSAQLIDLAQRWVDEPATNYGLVLLTMPRVSAQEWILASSQHVGDVLLRPRLCISLQGSAPEPTPSSTSSATPTVSATLTASHTPTITLSSTLTPEPSHTA